MENLNKNDIEFLIDCLKRGKEIPEEYKYALFPTKQKEYELIYAGKKRREDILADNEETKAVPLQIEKIFNGKRYPLVSKDWHNLLIFGDNLQILKTFYEDKDNLIRRKIKGKVKLIYIDPPFATEVDFRNSGAKAYSDKTKGAEFVEFLRRRLIIAKELMAEDGTIWVHLDYRKVEYIKVIMDELFPSCHLNTIHWRSQVPRGAKSSADFLPKSCQQILIYKKSVDAKPLWIPPKREIILTEDEISKESAYKKDEKTGNYFRTSDPGTYSFESLVDFHKKGRLYVSYGGKIIVDSEKQEIRTTKGTIGIKYYAKKVGKDKFKIIRSIDNIWTDIPGLGTTPGEDTGYPTQKTEALLDRIIRATTEESDLVMDFFAGSGTTLAVAEKLNRHWIGCDIGKLSVYTIQKRLLEIDKSRDLENLKKKYGRLAKSFAVVSAGLYDLEKVLNQVKDRYIQFVSDLFEVERLESKKIGGVTMDGKKGEFYVQIFPYWKFRDANVDEEYVEDLHKNIGRKIDERFYIIAPANSVDFITDYYEIGNIRYYFLKVPYQIIKELHKVQFKKLRQPQSKKNINNLDDAIGFHFIKQPEVQSKLEVNKDKVYLRIRKFESQYTEEETGEKLDNFESLAMVLVDLKYNGEVFLMTKYFFADDLISKKEENEDEIKKELKKKKEIKIEFDKKECGKNIMAVYVDIYGNEFKEILRVE